MACARRCIGALCLNHCVCVCVCVCVGTFLLQAVPGKHPPKVAFVNAMSSTFPMQELCKELLPRSKASKLRTEDAAQKELNALLVPKRKTPARPMQCVHAAATVCVAACC